MGSILLYLFNYTFSRYCITVNRITLNVITFEAKSNKSPAVNLISPNDKFNNLPHRESFNKLQQ